MSNLNLSGHRPATPRVAEDPEPFATPREVIEYLGVTPQALDALMKQFGVGRYHLPRDHDQIVYSLKDIERVKRSLASPKRDGPVG